MGYWILAFGIFAECLSYAYSFFDGVNPPRYVWAITESLIAFAISIFAIALMRKKRQTGNQKAICALAFMGLAYVLWVAIPRVIILFFDTDSFNDFLWLFVLHDNDNHRHIFSIIQAIIIIAASILSFYLIPRKNLFSRLMGFFIFVFLGFYHLLEVATPRIMIMFGDYDLVSGVAMVAYTGLDYYVEVYIFLVAAYFLYSTRTNKKPASEFSKHRAYLGIKPNLKWHGLLFSFLTGRAQYGQAVIILDGVVFGFSKGCFKRIDHKSPRSFKLFEVEQAKARKLAARLYDKQWSFLNNCLTRIYAPLSLYRGKSFE